MWNDPRNAQWGATWWNQPWQNNTWNWGWQAAPQAWWPQQQWWSGQQNWGPQWSSQWAQPWANQSWGNQGWTSQPWTPWSQNWNQWPTATQWQGPWQNQWQSANQWNPQHQEGSPIRFRENETHLFCEVYLPAINVGDVELEVSGNRIIWQTCVPVAQDTRWLARSSWLPRGIEVFELPDGRMEFSWVVPVSFVAKDIEATFRDGYLSICLPKSDVAATRQPIKINKETAKESRRPAAGMNS